MPGWIATSALAPGGTGADQLSIATAQIADGAITAAKLDEAAVNVGRYGFSVYGDGSGAFVGSSYA